MGQVGGVRGLVWCSEVSKESLYVQLILFLPYGVAHFVLAGVGLPSVSIISDVDKWTANNNADPSHLFHPLVGAPDRFRAPVL